MQTGFYILGEVGDTEDDILVEIGPGREVAFITFINMDGADKEIMEVFEIGDEILKAYEEGKLIRLSNADTTRLRALVEKYMSRKYFVSELPSSYVIAYRLNV
jgi:hypothetical protein